MDRRNFLTGSVARAASLAAVNLNATTNTAVVKKHQFKRKYAPHFNMFQQSAGREQAVIDADVAADSFK